MAQVSAANSRLGTDGSSADIRVALLGPLAVTRSGEPIEVTGPKRRALLALLALHINRPVGRDQIIEAIWPSRHTGREESTLRVHISHLRDELEPDRSGEPKVVVTKGQAYMLSGHRVDLDTIWFQELTREAHTLLEEDPGHALDLLNDALALWRGRPLQDVEYEEFAQEEIRRLEGSRLDAIEDRAKALIAVDEDLSAVQDLEPIVRADPTRERPTLLLMRALYRLGRQPDALRTARRHTRHLAQQGLEPSPRLTALEDQILGHDPTLLPDEAMSPERIKPGRSVRGYELREEAGRGSVGIVFRAFQASVGREVALKVIDPEVAGTSEFVRRFAEEARVIASLEHPHIVPLHDFWREPGGAFLVMRWMGGGTLADRLGDTTEPEALMRVFDQIGSALAYAHSCGVVHRDVKPANVHFDGDGNAYLADFGLAVTGIETGGSPVTVSKGAQPPYASPELTRGEGPTVASDIFSLGVLLAEAASAKPFPDSMDSIPDSIWNVVNIAVAANPADRFPDVDSFRLALREAVGDSPTPVPRTIRRNPYKGLEPFDEGDSADFYGRDDVVDTLLGAMVSNGLVALVGASGSGKSSVVRAGLVPALRDGAIPGSEEWSIVTMVPATDPFDEFHIALRQAAVGSAPSTPDAGHRELRQAFAAALDGPHGRALLIVDQFEELFAPSLQSDARDRFIDNLIDLTGDPSQRVRVVITMRADFSDRPLAHPGFGDLFARASYLLAPMSPEQVEEAIRGPATRVGVQIEPGLTSEIIRDIADAPASLPLLQYILAELFELRTEDRLTVSEYRSLGGVDGVLERRAEATFSSLDDGGKRASRQLFLRMVHIGDHGEETRRRLALIELSGLGSRASVDAALEAFATARLLTFDRDPVSRTPTVEVAHETVIERWTRYRVWIDEARSDLLAHRRITAAAGTWVQSGEDAAYLLTGGPLTAALDLASGDRIRLNELETRFVEESRRADETARRAEEERSRHEIEMQRRSRRRLGIGIGAAVMAMVVGTLAVFALVQRQRADELAAQQSRENLSREVAALSLANLDSGNPDLSLLLAVAAAEETLNAGGEILPEAVEALHRAVINPRPSVIITGALGENEGEAISYSGSGDALAYVTVEGEIAIIDPVDGSEELRIEPGSPAVGVDFHPGGTHVLTIHRDGVAEWNLATLEASWVPHADVSTAAYSRDGSVVAIGDHNGSITLYDAEGQVTTTLDGSHEGAIASVDFDQGDDRLVSAGSDGQTLIWHLGSASLIRGLEYDTDFCVWEASWHPVADEIVVSLCHGEAFTFDAGSGARLRPISLANQHHSAMVYDASGAMIAGAGRDGVTRIFNSEVGGTSAFDIPSGGVPVTDVEVSPRGFESIELATVGLDGELRIHTDVLAWSELPYRNTGFLYPYIEATPDGSRYVVGAPGYIWGLPQHCEDEWTPELRVVAAMTDEVLATHETVCTQAARSLPAISDDGSLVAFVGPSLNVVLLDVATGTSVEIPDSERWTADLAFSSDGRLLAGVGRVGPGEGQVAVWEVGSLERIRGMSPGLQSVPDGKQPLSERGLVQIAFRPESTDVITAGRDGSIRAWNTADGTNRILDVFEFELRSMAVSPDGASVVAADMSGDLRHLDIETGRQIGPPLQGVPGATDVVFSPDGRRLAGGGPGPVVYLWDLESGEIERRIGNAVGPQVVVFVNDGQDLRTISAEGVIRGYTLQPIGLLEIAREKVDRSMTEEECRRYLRRSCDD